VTGMILQTSPLKEYDRRVEILTRERGRISAFAQGARRPNSALSACTILFTFGTFTLYPGRDSYRLQSGSIQTQFGELAQDYDALCYCSYFGEMARYFTREGVEASRELMLLYVTLRAVMHGKMTLPLVRVIYELRLMLIEGEMVELFQCLHCGTKEVNTVYLQAGGLLCPACAAKDKTTKDAYPIQLSSDALYTLQYILTSEWSKLYAFGVSEEVLRELTHFMKRYLGRYLPHQFKSEAFLKQILRK
jgi:DNA repair protein RecO (recombination protein O)